MDSMVNRLARAIYAHFPESTLQQTPFGKQHRTAHYDDIDQRKFIAAARDMLSEMKSPTAEMLQVLSASSDQISFGLGEQFAIISYSRMIDAAIKSGG